LEDFIQKFKKNKMTKRQAIVMAAGSLTHPIKKSIIDQLTQSKLSVISITNELRSQGYSRLEQPATSSYLSNLQSAGLISFEKSGKYHIYKVNKKGQLLKDFQSRYDALIRTQQTDLVHPNMSSEIMQGGNLPLYAAAMLVLDNPKVKKILALFATQDEWSPSAICFELRDGERYNSVISNKLRDMRKTNLIYVSKIEGRMIRYALNKPTIGLLQQFEDEF
jgi:DNA-binding transcriptional ArsR family regulator